MYLFSYTILYDKIGNKECTCFCPVICMTEVVTQSVTVFFHQFVCQNSWQSVYLFLNLISKFHISNCYESRLVFNIKKEINLGIRLNLVGAGVWLQLCIQLIIEYSKNNFNNFIRHFLNWLAMSIFCENSLFFITNKQHKLSFCYYFESSRRNWVRYGRMEGRTEWQSFNV